VPEPADVLRPGLAAHPAVRAWRTSYPCARCPDSIQVVKREDKSTVYRLLGAGPAGSALIVKRCLPEAGRLERTVYEEILPQVLVTSLQYYGSFDEAGEYCWLFLEDAGAERYSPEDPVHRALAGRWLGVLHTGAAHLAPTACLPDRGPGYYLGRLRAARLALTLGLGNPFLGADEPGDIRAVIAQCDLLESRWSRLEEACAEVPATLVHGDFRPKNVHLRTGPTGPVVLPMDWEHAGQGVPAADLTRVDLVAYRSAVRERWPQVGSATLQRLADVGRILVRLAAIDWISTWLGFDSRILLLKPIAHLAVHRAGLAEELETAGLAR
jgi:hypothetical protein